MSDAEAATAVSSRREKEAAKEELIGVELCNGRWSGWESNNWGEAQDDVEGGAVEAIWSVRSWRSKSFIVEAIVVATGRNELASGTTSSAGPEAFVSLAFFPLVFGISTCPGRFSERFGCTSQFLIYCWSSSVNKESTFFFKYSFLFLSISSKVSSKDNQC